MVSTAISNVALPYYSKKLNQEGPESASKYVSNLMTVITVLTLAIILILEVFAGAVIKLFAPGLAPEVEDLAKLLFRLVLPTILLTELVNINTTIQDVNKSFVLPLLGSVILNTTFVFFVCLLAKTGGIYAAVLGVIIGTILEFGYL
jgi:putative peptidoglycan lipid II flippase